MLDRPPLSGATHAGLDLIDDEQNTMFIAQTSQGGEEAIRRYYIPTFTLDRLDEDSCAVLRWHNLTQSNLFNEIDNRLTVIVVV